MYSPPKKKAPTPFQVEAKCPRSNPRLPPVMAEEGMRVAFLSAETTEYCDSRSRNLT